ncbi:hypothetical protein BU25DRAFT_76618 [Macroventuria anomochaeta]|uniref:Uncharacterized protein n=1 Tax=Macroventuria anomochaeta TaxID=301207 RepID=A0ACB6SHH3_9PLEO|nr:uncharacterized protein BU25DRAFT_76618 [Macroventuria anomochaeta]KAF2632542.1 hypothetical protein BU25DRAFT_76618 [Macroventuria anomochaeta]
MSRCPAPQHDRTARLRCGVAVTPAGVSPHGHVSPTLETITLSMRLSEAQSGALEQSPETAWSENLSNDDSTLHLAYHPPRISVCVKVGLQHSKLETTMLGSPTIFPHNIALRLRAKMSTKADIDQAWNCFIGQPSILQGLEMSISALRPALPAILTLV